MAKAPFDVASELRLVPGLAEADVGADVLAELAAEATHRVAHANVTLLAQGAVSPHLIVLVRGAVKLVHQPADVENADPIVLTVARAPCRVPDTSIFDGRPAMASIVTLRSSQVLTIASDALLAILPREPSLSRYLLTQAADDARAYVQRIDELVTGSADERIIRLLDGLARAHGTPLGQGRFIAIPLRRRDIARMVNATTETVSRLLARLERDGRARSTRDGIWWLSPRASAESLASTAHPRIFRHLPKTI
ncbi:Crp/Fnr family transcriptional regulator [Pendulispora albinea]|uniref:Helix-turn-helix domain-containing protein n=1 Tax=Pendulispora albinea TaxID=2741071 RepID=A0ABZ2LU60_9BACT